MLTGIVKCFKAHPMPRKHAKTCHRVEVPCLKGVKRTVVFGICLKKKQTNVFDGLDFGVGLTTFSGLDGFEWFDGIYT